VPAPKEVNHVPCVLFVVVDCLGRHAEFAVEACLALTNIICALEEFDHSSSVVDSRMSEFVSLLELPNFRHQYHHIPRVIRTRVVVAILHRLFGVVTPACIQGRLLGNSSS
jgi:hypothetical protein